MFTFLIILSTCLIIYRRRVSSDICNHNMRFVSFSRTQAVLTQNGKATSTASVLLSISMAALIELRSSSVRFIVFLDPIMDLATSVKDSTHWVKSPFMVPFDGVSVFSDGFFSFLFPTCFRSSTSSVPLRGWWYWTTYEFWIRVLLHVVVSLAWHRFILLELMHSHRWRCSR